MAESYAAAQPESPPEVSSIVKRLDEEAQELRDRFSVLVDRLTPILSPESPPNAETALRAEESTPLGRELAAIRDQLGTTLRRVNETLGRLEL